MTNRPQPNSVCDPHSFVRFVGFDLEIVPIVPFEATVDPKEPHPIDLHVSENGLVRITPNNGGFKSALSPSIRSVYDCVAIRAHSSASIWSIETSIYGFSWPKDCRITSISDSSVSWPFEMIFPQSIVVFIQVPRFIPSLERMRAHNQTLMRTGHDGKSRWVELAYQHQHEYWIQRHAVTAVGDRELVVTAQGPRNQLKALAKISNSIIEALKGTGSAETGSVDMKTDRSGD